VTSHYPDRCFAFDQFGPLSIRPCHGTCWAPRKHPARLRATYHRTHGIRYFHGCYGIGDDQLWGVVRQRKGADHTLAALKSVRAARPGGYRLFVIMDNLSANKPRRSAAGPSERTWSCASRPPARRGPTRLRRSSAVTDLRHGQLRLPGPHRPGPPAARLSALAQRPRPPPRRPGRPAPRTRPHPQRTPAAAGPAQA